MKLENHALKLREHLRALEWAVRQDNQSSIGFHASAGSVEVLSILLHRLMKVQLDFQINHGWFKSKGVLSQKMPFDFPRKEEILRLMWNIEELRNPLCYGSPRPESSIDEILESFYKIKEIVEGILGEKLE
ncbi:MAG: hypothetical protein FJY76_01450 [Candidatus Aenigmarchaeota archaeon]|nr:hypothetical protein [Candidatus Aenigmarchaeota archaeon]